MKEDKVTNECRFCGQMVVGPSWKSAEDICNCSGAMKYRDRTAKFEKMRGVIERYFGENCKEVSPEFGMVDEETYAFICQCAERVALSDSIDAVTVKLTDSSVAVITYGYVERKIAIKRKEAE